MIITVLNVSQPEKVKTYFTIEVNYKNEKGQTQGKKLMSFSAPDVYNVLKGASSGEQYDITVKQEGQYWNWVGASKVEGSGGGKANAPVASSGGRGGYETAEEREKRQRLIVRQSSLTAALTTLSVGAKSVDKNAVKALAEEYTDWVFEELPTLKEDVSFDDLGDDIPM